MVKKGEETGASTRSMPSLFSDQVSPVIAVAVLWLVFAAGVIVEASPIRLRNLPAAGLSRGAGVAAAVAGVQRVRTHAAARCRQRVQLGSRPHRVPRIAQRSGNIECGDLRSLTRQRKGLLGQPATLIGVAVGYLGLAILLLPGGLAATKAWVRRVMRL